MIIFVHRMLNYLINAGNLPIVRLIFVFYYLLSIVIAFYGSIFIKIFAFIIILKLNIIIMLIILFKAILSDIFI